MEPFANNFNPIIPVEDELLHSQEKPSCFDSTCPYHEDQDSIAIVAKQVQDGLFTPQEATDFEKVGLCRRMQCVNK